MTLPVLQKHLDACITRYFEPTCVSATLREVLALAHDPARGAIDLVAPVIQDEWTAKLVLRTDFLQERLSAWIAESPEGEYSLRVILDRTFLLLGRHASRNLIAAIEMHRIAGTLPKKETDRLSVQPSDQLRYALLAEEFCQTHDFAFSEQAFLAGLHFDLLSAVFRSHRGPRDAMNALSATFSESLRAARVAYMLGTRVGEFQHNEWLFAATLVRGLGPLLMMALHPKELGTRSYAAFLAEGEKLKALKFAHLEHRERSRFGVQAVELAALQVSWIGILASVEPAIRYAHELATVRSLVPDQEKLAAVIHLASALAQGQPLGPGHSAALRTLKLEASAAQALGKSALNR